MMMVKKVDPRLRDPFVHEGEFTQPIAHLFDHPFLTQLHLREHDVPRAPPQGAQV